MRETEWYHYEPGALDNGKLREFCRTWPNQTELTVKGIHFIQEDSASEIGAARISCVVCAVSRRNRS
jgi:hypothetical protein